MVATHIAEKHAAFVLDNILCDDDANSPRGVGERTCQECGRTMDVTRDYMLGHVLYTHWDIFGAKLKRLSSAVASRFQVNAKQFLPMYKDRNNDGNGTNRARYL